jgi:hypothetical protein
MEKEKYVIRKNENDLTLKIENRDRIIFRTQCINRIHFYACLKNIVAQFKGEYHDPSIFNVKGNSL